MWMSKAGTRDNNMKPVAGRGLRIASLPAHPMSNHSDIRISFCKSPKIRFLFSAEGFTLLEVLIAVAIIAIALTGLLGSQTQSVTLANEAKFNTTAALLAKEKMAQLELEGFQGLTHDTGDFGDEFPGYRWELDVGTPVFDEIDNVTDFLKQADLTLYWGEGDRFAYRIRLYFFISE